MRCGGDVRLDTFFLDGAESVKRSVCFGVIYNQKLVKPGLSGPDVSNAAVEHVPQLEGVADDDFASAGGEDEIAACCPVVDGLAADSEDAGEVGFVGVVDAVLQCPVHVFYVADRVVDSAESGLEEFFDVGVAVALFLPAV